MITCSESTLLVTVNGNRIGDMESSHLGFFNNIASWVSKSRMSPGIERVFYFWNGPQPNV